MELATDIMAIIGWALFGLMAPILIEIRSRQCTSTVASIFATFISFGLIAASFVLG